MKTSNFRSASHCRGITLVELMVAVTIGMVILVAMSLLFANNSRARSETERSSQKVENGRFALELLSGELQHAGYFAEFDSSRLTAAAAVPDACATAVADLKTGMALHIQGFDSVSSSVLSCLSDVKGGTDILVIRRAATCTVGTAGCTAPVAGTVLFQTSLCATELASGIVNDAYRLVATASAPPVSSSDFPLNKRDCTSKADTRRYLVRIYYTANNDKAGDGIPTLKRAELTSTGGTLGFVSTSLVQGIENLQMEYGLDTDANGQPDAYASNPNAYGGCGPATTPTCAEHWRSVVSAKVFLLARNIDQSPGYTDNRVYDLGTTTVSAPGDAYKRSVFQETVRLVNASGRRM